ncbi:MAG: hypothetical protein IPK82_36240 [Polyangiaceae bacterium]|nr:hypothetical protein [Polyangiaceae bacterium]
MRKLSALRVASVLLFTFTLFGCSNEGSSSKGSGGSDSTATTGGTAGSTTGSAGTSATTSSTVATTTSSGTGTPTGDCDPPAEIGSLYELQDMALDETITTMCKYRGDVLLIVNTAEA